MIDRDLRVGVIGTGGMGTRHALNLHRHCRWASVVAVADPDGDRAHRLAAATGATILPSGEELIASAGVDAVIIASPDPTHAPLAIESLRRGRPTLLEKPLAPDLETARAVVEAERERPGRLVQLGFMRCYDPQHVALHRLLTSGAVGRPLLFRGWHRNLGGATAAPPTSLDVLVQSAVHDFHSARWLLGQEITEIHVRGTPVADPTSPHHELQLVSLSFDGGAIGSVEINRDSGFGYEVGVEVTGSSGVVSTAPHHTPVVRLDGRMGQPVEPDWLQRFEAAYVAEILAWAEAAARGSATGPGIWDGYVTLAAAVAGARSLATGRPVPLDLAL